MYHTVSSLDTGGAADPRDKSHAKDLIGQGLTGLNQATLEGGQVDPKVKNSAKALIAQGLTVLTKGETEKGTVDPKVTKDANALIDRILSADKMILKAAENTKIPKSGGLNDGGLLNDTRGNNDTKVPNAFLNKGGLLKEDSQITTEDNQITANKENSPTPPPCPNEGPIPPDCTMKPPLLK